VTHRVLTPILCLAIIGLAPAAPVPPGAEKPTLYFPTKVGTKWVYQTGEKVETHVVHRVQKKDGCFAVSVLRVDNDGKQVRLPDTTVSDRGLFWDEFVSQGGKQITLLKLPHRASDEWRVTLHKYEVKCTAARPEKVKVPAGEFESIPVEMEYAGGHTNVSWFAPGIGRVQWRAGERLTVLKAFTPGKN
jgi:hypothetical protein